MKSVIFYCINYLNCKIYIFSVYNEVSWRCLSLEMSINLHPMFYQDWNVSDYSTWIQIFMRLTVTYWLSFGYSKNFWSVLFDCDVVFVLSCIEKMELIRFSRIQAINFVSFIEKNRLACSFCIRCVDEIFGKVLPTWICFINLESAV